MPHTIAAHHARAAPAVARRPDATTFVAFAAAAVVPLLTLILSVVERVEAFRARGLVGAVTAALGIAFVFYDSIGVASPLALLALLGGALCMASVNVVIKKYPPVHPVVENALGMAIGGGLLLALSLAVGEPRAIPSQPATKLSLLFLIVFGSIGVFVLYLTVLGRWTASGASYIMLIVPLVTIGLGVVILGETVSAAFFVGGALVLAGVYVGAFTTRARSAARESR